MKNFKELKVWQRSHRLTLSVYKLTKTFPKEELYGLVSQMRRACVSIAANIAEGCGKNSDADFGRYLSIANGSASELAYYLLLANDLKILTDKEYVVLHNYITVIMKMLYSLKRKLKASG
jgi:four helix bundle protein